MNLEHTRAAARQQWSADAAVRAEFTTVDTWLAYSLAVAQGRLKVAPPCRGTVRMNAAQAGSGHRAVLLREGGAAQLRLHGPLTLAAAGTALPSRFSGVAYSGGFVPDYGLVIDLSSTTFKQRMPLLNSHWRSDIVGVVEQAANKDGAMTVAGRLFSDMAGSAAERIAQLAQRGAPFEMSVGLYAFAEDAVPAGKSANVNGQVFNGPLNVLRNGQVREVSIVTLGADPRTEARFL